MSKNFPEQLVLAANQNIREREYWLEHLKGEFERAIFPYDYKFSLESRPGEGKAWAYTDIVFNPGTVERLQGMSKGSGYVLNLLFQAGIAILLSRYSGRGDVIVGMPIYKQSAEDGVTRETYINRVLPLRHKIDESLSVKEFLSNVRQTIKEAVEYLNYPVELLVDQLGLEIPGTEPGFPLFDVGVLVNTIHFRGDLDEVQPNVVFSFNAGQEGIQGQVEYNPRLYSQETAKRIANHFLFIMDQLTSGSERKLATLELITEEERERILVDFNQTATGYPKNQSIVELFDVQVQLEPDRVAVECGDECVTYRYLQKGSLGLAGRLSDVGVEHGSIVSLMMETSIDMIIAILGILRTGGIYMPIDPQYPSDRLEYMLKDSHATVLITGQDERLIFPGVMKIACKWTGKDEVMGETFEPTRAGDIAYIIYTSGSTGRAKGVMVLHRGVVRLVKNTNYVEFERGGKVLQTGALTFDASTFEIWGSLLNGMTLCLIDREDLVTPMKLKRMVHRCDITMMWMTAPLFNRMIQEEPLIFSRLKNLLVGGDVLSPSHIQRVKEAYPGLNVINGYGPTENTTFSACHLIQTPIVGNIPIGRPIANSTAYIVDSRQRLLPVGVAGELWVGGDGVAIGYLNQPELTAEKFIKSFPGVQGAVFQKSPLGKAGTLYKTGDFARWLADGTIEFLGRRDFQVKIRGFRIEPEEIEGKLLTHPAVKHVVVIPRTQGKGDTGAGEKEKYLCAYLVLDKEGYGNVRPTELREYLSGKLPDYMIPSYFVVLEHIPLTVNGKVDRRALPVPDVRDAATVYMPPRDKIEKQLVEIWAKELGMDSQIIGIDNDFFDLGGHSLKATGVISRIHQVLEKDIELRVFFSHPTIRQLAAVLREADKRAYVEIEAVEEKEYYDLSYAQRRLWILCQFEADSVAYNMPGMFPLAGVFSMEAFEKAVQTLVDRHQILRTVFITLDGLQKQRILREFKFHLLQSDLRHLAPSVREKEAQRIYTADSSGAFDLENGPLFRFRYIRMEDEKCIIVFIIHHIISDGWSQGVIQGEVLSLYNVFAVNIAAQSPILPLKLQYKDYTCWHNGLIEGRHFTGAGEFWLTKFADKPNGLELPYDHPRRPMQTFNGRRVSFILGEKNMERLHRLRESEDATLFMGLLSLFNIFWYRYTGQEDIIIGSPIAGRRQPELHPLIGFLVNTLVYRNRVIPQQSLREHLDQVKIDTLACYDFQDYPFDLLVDRLDLERDLSQSPLFNVMLAHNNTDIQGREQTMEGLSVYGFEQNDDFNMSKFDLTAFMDMWGDDVLVRWEYNTDLFESTTTDRMIRNFRFLVDELLEHPDVPVHRVAALHPEEYEMVVNTFNSTAHVFSDLLLPQMIEAQVERTPGKQAVVWEKAGEEPWETISYKELNSRANRLAHFLRLHYQVKPGHIIGLSLDRSIDLIISILGIIKSGAGYVAIDPNYPEDRVLHMLNDSQCQLLVRDYTNPHLFQHYQGETIILPDDWNRLENQSSDNPTTVNTAGDVIYVIYTSGTTGTPNGAMLSHGIMTNLVKWQHEQTSIDGSLRCLQFTSVNFCVSFQEIMTTLTAGGEVHLIGDIVRQDVNYLMEFLSRHGIENLYLPFSYLNFLFNETERWGKTFNHSLKHIITAGEQLKITAGLKDFLDRHPYIHLHNHYGSSEMHVVAAYTLDASSAHKYPVPPAGRPLANTRIYILDDHGNPVPIGAWGELFVEGSAEVSGYINNEELTNRKLLAMRHLTGNDKKLYRSGDVGRWLEDGNIELKGRKDSQVKIRGFRVELSEIESRLLSIDRVKACVVVVIENAARQKELLAYVVKEDIEIAEIKKFLGLYMPQYMIPRFVVLNELPLMPNGKVDRERLPVPDITAGTKETYTAPVTDLEKKLVTMWSRLLEMSETSIGVDDNFFDIGGHSLKATTMISHIFKEFHVKASLVEIFNGPTIREIARYIESLAKETYSSLEEVENKEYYPLSPAQKRLYILYQLDPGDTGYNLATAMELEGDIDRSRFDSVFQCMIERQESLRTSFHMIEHFPGQRIHDPASVSFSVNYQEGVDPEQVACIHGSFIQPFQFDQAPLFRVALVKFEERRFLFLVDMHHIISDGVSLGIIVREFVGFYNNEILPPLSIQYKDFSYWQNRLIHSGEMKKQESFWLNQFDGPLPVLDIPLDFPRPVIPAFEGRTLHMQIDMEETATLVALAAQTGGTLFMVIEALVTTWLARLSGQEDVVVGTPVAGRRHPDLEPLIGMFVNTLALRQVPGGDKRFSNYVTEVKNRTLSAFENQDYQFEELVERLAGKMDRRGDRNPLFDVMFTLQNMDIPEITIPGITIKPYGFQRKSVLFDLYLSVAQTGDILLVSLDYRTSLFTQKTIQRFADYFKAIVSAVTQSENVRIGDIEVITPTEKHQILQIFNATRAEFPRDMTIQGIFERQVEKTPGAIALLDESSSLTYLELNHEVDCMAWTLTEKGVGPGTITAIRVNRSVKMMIDLLAILKTGSIYLPIDPSYPDERVQYMLKDSGACVLITDKPGFSSQGEIALIDHSLSTLKRESWQFKSYHQPEEAAYVIYTSGSTGKPKGVLVEHCSVMNRLHWMQRAYPLEPADCIMQKTSIAFDVSVWELFWWSFTGASLFLPAPGDEKNPEAIIAGIHQHRVTTIHFVPSMLSLFLDTVETRGYVQELKSLRLVFSSGEALSAIRVQQYSRLLFNTNQTRLINLYGPTEATVDVSYYNCDLAIEHIPASIPIGKPIDNTYLLVVDSYGNIQPVGLSGELYIGGVAVARGYLNRPELTQQKFVSSHSLKLDQKWGDCFYKTGDLVRWLDDGNIEFLGRIDFQVKIRGFRIELGEIEERLLKHETVKEVVVLAREGEDHDKYLCGYLVLSEPGCLKEPLTLMEELKEFLGHTLPNYMVPPFFVILEKLPLTANGKINRAALPEPGRETRETYVAPRNDREEKLAKVWADILKRERVGIDDHFFLTGGHSLTATVLLSRIHQLLGIKIPLAILFKTPTIRGLENYINAYSGQPGKAGFKRIEKTADKEYYRVSSAQKRQYLLHGMEPDSVQYNMPQVIPMESEADIKKIEQVFHELLKRHESLRTSFHLIADHPVQKVHEPSEITFTIAEWVVEDGVKQKPAAIMRDFVKPFDLAQPPLIRAGVAWLPGETHHGPGYLIIDMHHIITDGVSQTILAREFNQLYPEQSLPPLKLQYRDYAEWQTSETYQQQVKNQETYWVKEFTADIPVLYLPYDFPRPAVQVFAGSNISFYLNPEDTQKLRQLIREKDVTLFMAMLAVYQVLLSILSGQDDIVVGVPVAGRNHVDLQDIIGMFVNTLPFRNFPDSEKSFADFLAEVKERTLEAFENQDYPFEDIVEHTAVPRDISRNPLFDVMFSWQNQEEAMDTRAGYRPGIQHGEPGDVQCDLSCDCVDTGPAIFISMPYCTGLFKPETIDRFAGYFLRLVSAILQEPDHMLSRLDILDHDEKQKLLFQFNQTQMELTGWMTLHQRFEDQVACSLDRVALVGPIDGYDDSLPIVQVTYHTLDDRANRVAAHLKNRGIMPYTIIAIIAERSIEVLSCILGILKANGMYCPIDPQYPLERIEYMLKDSATPLLITSAGMTRQAVEIKGWQGDIICWDDLDSPAIPIHSLTESAREKVPGEYEDAPAYIIYTSGSTGKPKGVIVEHRQAVAYLSAFEKEFKPRATDILLQQASFAFDVSVEEIYSILLSGGRLVMPPTETLLDMQRLSHFIIQYHISMISCSPHLLNELNRRLAAEKMLIPVRLFISGGDVLKYDYIDYIVKQTVVYNTYGPTETAIGAIYYPCTDQPLTHIPIGKPIANYQVYILNKNNLVVPIGVPGELCIAGLGVTRGYLNRPELTAEKFILTHLPGPLTETNENQTVIAPGKGTLLYRSGDLASWLPDGNIRFLGRVDNQVQIRGYRVEPGEVEKHLEALDGIRQALVIPLQDRTGQLYLCGYLLCTGDTLDEQKIKSSLARELPPYMIPAYLVRLDNIPLTRQGKVDRGRLPGPLLTRDETYEAPRDEMENHLAAIWSDILGINQDIIGIDTNFFQLGGNSIKVMAVGSRIKEVLNQDVPVVKLFVYPTIRALSGWLTSEATPGQVEKTTVTPKDRSEILDSRRSRIKEKRKRK